MTDIIKGLNLIIRTCELWKDYENKTLTKEQAEQRADALVRDVTAAYNESDKKDDPEVQKDYKEMMEQYSKFKNWIKTADW